MDVVKRTYDNLWRLTHNYVKAQRNGNQHHTMPPHSHGVTITMQMYSHTVTCREGDPVLGRFLSPDPVLQAPENTQNYNKYAYVLNNPLKYTDPSGYMSQHYIVQTNMYAEMSRIALQLSAERQEAWGDMKAQIGSGSLLGNMYLGLAIFGSLHTGGGGDGGTKPATADAPDGGDGGGDQQGNSATNTNVELMPNVILMSDLRSLPLELRQLFMTVFAKMMSEDKTYLNDRLTVNGLSSLTIEEYAGFALLGSLSGFFPVYGIYALTGLVKGAEDIMRIQKYKDEGRNMGVYTEVRDIPYFLTNVQVTDVYWGYNGDYWFTYNGVFPGTNH